MFHPQTISVRLSMIFTLLVFTLIFVPLGQAAEPPRQAEAEWLVMMYQVADDETLEQDILFDLNEAEFIGSSDDVHVVAQVDRFAGGYDGMDDWTSTKRLYLTSDDDFESINSEEVADIGEVNMADAETLIDFLTWAIETYPAQRHALIMSDHGMGWSGGFSDPDPGILGPHDLLLAEGFGDSLWLMEIDEALGQVRAETGLDKFELIGFDVCLMGTIEVYTAMADHARYSVASQEEEPGVGWAYASILEQLTQNPAMDGAALGRIIVEAYIDEDIVVQAFPEAGEGDITLSAVDLAALSEVNQALDVLVSDLAALDQNQVAEARAYAQAFNSPIVGAVDETLPSSYIDLGHFAQLIRETNPDAGDSAGALMAAIETAVIAEKNGPTRPGATGMTIEFPVVDQYNVGDNLGYALIAKRFTDETKWDEFLAFHHTGARRDNLGAPQPPPAPQPIEPEEAVEIPGVTAEEALEELEADVAFLLSEGYTAEEAREALEVDYEWPAETVAFLDDAGVFDNFALGKPQKIVAKPIRVAPLSLSAEVTGPEAPVTIETEISGDRLGYVYSFIGRFLPREDVLIFEDMNYIVSETNQEVGGVTRPVWPEDGVSLAYEWEPTVYALSDGETSVRALFEPDTYGDEPTFLVKGLYTYAESGNTRPARISFRNGELSQVFVFSGREGVGAPRQVTPNPGDTFTVLERGIDLSRDEEADEENYSRESGTLTFGEQKFFIEATPAPSGNYIVGVIAEDLDGKEYEQYEGLFVVSEDEAAVDGFVPYVNESLEFALLHPESWEIEEDSEDDTVTIYDEESGTALIITRNSYPEARTTQGADDLAIRDLIEILEADGELENLAFITEEPEDFVLGAYDGKIFEFSFDLEETPFVASAVVASPVLDTTYGVMVIVPDETFEDSVEAVDSILFSFDVLISGLNKEQVGAPPPDIDEELFTDDFSDNSSGLIEDEEEQEWGQGFYAPTEQFVFEMKPDPGRGIHDYYLDEVLPDDFILEATVSYEGALDNAYGLIFQVIPAESEDEFDQFYSFRISGDGFYIVEKWSDDVETITDWTFTTAIDQEEGGENVLTIEGLGETYRLYVNGQQIDEFTDDSAAGLSEGAFGIIADNYDAESPVTISFDDLVMGTPAE